MVAEHAGGVDVDGGDAGRVGVLTVREENGHNRELEAWQRAVQGVAGGRVSLSVADHGGDGDRPGRVQVVDDHRRERQNPFTRPHLLPWTTPEGKPCFLSTDSDDSLLSRLADDIEEAQLDSGEQVLAGARAVLDDRKAGARVEAGGR